MIDKVKKSECVLCGGCKNTCPTDAIALEGEYLGFSYPEINNSLCIACNKCESACPVLQPRRNLFKGYPTAYIGRVDEREIRLKSTSGGVFWALATKTLDNGGFVCGAVFDDKFNVKHIVSNKLPDIKRMMGSKYAQSDIGICFRKIKVLLEQGKDVLFTGLPCQIAGLRSYLKIEYKQLFLLEVVCHGVPSNQALKGYLSLLERKYHSKVRCVEFRNKIRGWHLSSVMVEFENGRVYIKPIVFDAYMGAFLGSSILKESCYSCLFRNGKSGADITIGDFWGAEKEMPTLDDNTGLSAIIVNTESGEVFLKQTDLMLTPCNLDVIVKYNKNIIESPKPNPRRECFYKYSEEKGIEKAFLKFFWEKPFAKLRRIIGYAVRWAWNYFRKNEKPLY